jgi:hypothetical protein
MPFDTKFDDIYKFGIKGAADEVGAYAERVDEQTFTEGILDRISTFHLLSHRPATVSLTILSPLRQLCLHIVDDRQVLTTVGRAIQGPGPPHRPSAISRGTR